MREMRELLDHLGRALAVRDPRALWQSASVEERCEFLARVEQFESFRCCIRDIETLGLTLEQIALVSEMQLSQMQSITCNYWTPERFARALRAPARAESSRPGELGAEQPKLPTHLSQLAI